MLPFLKNKNIGKLEITISNRTVIRVLVSVFAFTLALAALRATTHALTLIFTAFFLTLALNAPVHWLAQHLPGKRRGSRTIATAVSFLVVVVFLVTFLASIVPPIIRQTNSFISAAPGLVEDARTQDGAVGEFIRKYHLESQVESFSQQLSDRLSHGGTTALSAVSSVGARVFSLLTVLVITFMMLIEGPRWMKLFNELLPEEKRPRASKLSLEMYHVIRGYVNGQVLLAFIAACLIAPMLFILGISYPIALVLLVFICGLIPMVGHTIGALTVSVVALFHSPAAALIILAYYILYQQIENYIVQPRVQAKGTNLSPLLVFLAVVIGVSFGGLLGGLVAIPLMGCLRVLVVDVLERRKKSVLAVDPTVETK